MMAVSCSYVYHNHHTDTQPDQTGGARTLDCSCCLTDGTLYLATRRKRIKKCSHFQFGRKFIYFCRAMELIYSARDLVHIHIAHRGWFFFSYFIIINTTHADNRDDQRQPMFNKSWEESRPTHWPATNPMP